MVKSLPSAWFGPDLHVVLADELDIMVDDFPGQAEIGNAHGQHAAGDGQGFEDRLPGTPAFPSDRRHSTPQVPPPQWPRALP